jgi:hypothetical protein
MTLLLRATVRYRYDAPAKELLLQFASVLRTVPNRSENMQGAQGSTLPPLTLPLSSATATVRGDLKHMLNNIVPLAITAAVSWTFGCSSCS